MSGVVWSKFYWSDWESEPCLRLCSLGAQGLWMRMLCVAAQHEPVGYVALAGRGLEAGDLARLVGETPETAAALLAELERNGVFGRDRRGTIFSRRMIRDARAAETARRNGEKGGNPSLSKGGRNPPRDNPFPDLPDKGPDKGPDKPHKPYASTRVGGPDSPPNPGGAAGRGRAGGPPPAAPPEPGARDGQAREGQAREGQARSRAVPAEVRAQVAGRMGEDYARAWLDPAGWEVAADGGGRIVCRLGFAADRLNRDLRRWLADAGIAVTMAGAGEEAGAGGFQRPGAAADEEGQQARRTA